MKDPRPIKAVFAVFMFLLVVGLIALAVGIALLLSPDRDRGNAIGTAAAGLYLTVMGLVLRYRGQRIVSKAARSRQSKPSPENSADTDGPSVPRRD